MKSIKNIINTTALMTMGLVSLSSCTDGNDWTVDDAYSRLFGTRDITLDIYDTKVGVKFNEIKGAEGYQVEISTDSLYLDDISESSIVNVLTSSPDTIRNLAGETKYYLRMRSVANNVPSSKWVYYEASNGNAYFTTKSEQLFNELTSNDIDESTVHLTWKAGEEVTNIVVLKGDEEVQNITLSADAIANGEYTIEGLDPTTTYTINLMNGSTKRGVLKATTTAAMPSASYKVTLTGDVTIIDQDLIDQLAATAQEKAGSTTNYSVTIGIPAGTTLNFHGVSDTDGSNTNIRIPDGMSVTFFGLAGDAPTIKMQKNLDFEGSHAFIKFQHVNIVDDGAAYFVNQSKSATVDEFTLEDVEAKDFKTSFFRLQGSNGITVNKLTLNNSIFHDMCSGYSFIHVDAGSGKGAVKNIKITDCTLYNVATGGKMFIYSKKTDMESIEIDHLTMYNSIGNGNYLVDFGDTSHGASKFTISNTIFGKQPDDNNKGVRASVAPEFSNTYYTNDFFKKVDATALEVASSAVFADPENGNFTLNDSYIKLGAGDSRWIVTE